MFILKRMIIVCICSMILSINIVNAEKRKLIVVGEEFAPFEFIQNGKVVGIDIDITSTIFKKMNVPVEFKIIPWKRAWKNIETGDADAVLTTSRKEKRKPFLWYPEEDMWRSEFVFFVKKDRMLSDFKGYQTAIDKKLKVGIIKGNSYHPSFWEAFPYKSGATTFQGDLADEQLNAQLDGARNFEMNIRKLVKRRFDIMPSDKIVGSYSAKMYGFGKEITYYNISLYSKGYPMPFAKKSSYPNLKEISVQFEKELKLLKKNGEYQQIIDRWLK